MNNATDWYSEPLSAEDLLAGISLISFGTTFILLYGLVARVMFKNDQEVIGYRFLFSASLADMLLLVNYSVWPGITILAKSEIISPSMRHWIQMYLDWVWFSMCYHYMIISWSRLAAIRSPHAFRIQTRTRSYACCFACYVIAFVQVLCTHFQPWYVTFYFEPSSYGMLAEDFDKYLRDGQSVMFFTFHLMMIVIPIFFYSRAIYLLIEQRTSSIARQKCHGSNHHHHHQSTVETRLMIPCICNTFVFIVGQVVITMGTGEGKWATWMVLFLFSANSAVNPVLLLVFSPSIRRKLLEELHLVIRFQPQKYNTFNFPTKGSVSPANTSARLHVETEYFNLSPERKTPTPV